MNWGNKILVVYTIFILGIALLVYKSTTQKFDMVTTDYYAKELKYQDKLDAIKRVNALATSIQIELKDQQLKVNFPAAFANKNINGNVLLYCPSDENKDFKQNFSNSNAAVNISLPAGIKGAYEIQISWQTDGRDYYFEKTIFL